MNPIDLYTNPDDVDEAEYRAIYDWLSAALFDCPPRKRIAVCRAALENFRDSAENMLHILDKNVTREENQ